MPFAKNRQRHGRNCGTGGVTDRAFYKKSPKARSKSRHRRRNRPCLLQKIGKGTVEMAGQQAQSTVPFVKKRQRHGRNRRAAGATDRASCKKTTKARSKSRSSGRNRPCLLQKNDKGTVEIAAQAAQPTVPFAKKRQRHGRNRGTVGATDRAFYKKASQARSKSWHRRCNRPCLLQKIGKGTVEIAAQAVQPTVPFAKNRQRHGRNRGVDGVTDRAFCKKSSKARSKSQGSGHNRPCLSQKIAKGTVEIAE